MDFGPKVFTEENLALVEQLRGFAESRGHTLLELSMAWLAAKTRDCFGHRGGEDDRAGEGQRIRGRVAIDRGGSGGGGRDSDCEGPRIKMDEQEFKTRAEQALDDLYRGFRRRQRTTSSRSTSMRARWPSSLRSLPASSW